VIERHRAYWRKTLTMTGRLLYAAIIAFYAWYLRKQTEP
jgi:hypothetical protein